MKRIGIDARFMLRPMRGIPLYVTRLCQFLPGLNRDLQFYLFINKGFEHNDAPQNYQPILDEIEQKNPNVSIVNVDHDAEIIWEQFFLPRLIKKHNVELLHMPANRTCFFPGVSTVVTIHDVIEYKMLTRSYWRDCVLNGSNLREIGYLARRSAYVWSNYKIGFHRAAQVITVSEFSATDIVETLQLSPSKVSAIHHGLDSDFVMSDADSTHIELSSRKFVLMLGGDCQHKNPEGAICAWGKVPETIRRKYPLKIIGFCGDDHSPLLRALREHGLQDEVELKGWVTQSELIACMREAALFIYLSRYEGFGFPPLHAMASGTPVIASYSTSIPEVLGGAGFKFDPDDHDGVANGIEMVLKDCALWQQQSEAGLARVKSFSWNQSAVQHLKVYEKATGDCRESSF